MRSQSRNAFLSLVNEHERDRDWSIPTSALRPTPLIIIWRELYFFGGNCTYIFATIFAKLSSIFSIDKTPRACFVYYGEVNT